MNAALPIIDLRGANLNGRRWVVVSQRPAGIRVLYIAPTGKAALAQACQARPDVRWSYARPAGPREYTRDAAEQEVEK